jgi:hypothetical protein
MHRLAPAGGGQLADQVTGEVIELAGRHLVLGYGSNLNPQKLAGKYNGEEVDVLATTVHNWATVWCNARRHAGDVVATLVPWPGMTYTHAVIVVTDAQRDVMDAWEGHPRYYRREPFRGRVVLENDTEPTVEVYLGTPERRPVLQHGEKMLPVHGQDAVSYDVVDQLVPRWP